MTDHFKTMLEIQIYQQQFGLNKENRNHESRTPVLPDDRLVCGWIARQVDQQPEFSLALVHAHCFARVWDRLTSHRAEERHRDIVGSVSEPPKPKIHTSITVYRADGSVFQRVGSSIKSEILEGSVEGVENLARQNYPPVGHCIYCGETDSLSREHIIPFGLNGNAVLAAASCARCRNITASFEREVLRGSMRTVRVLLKFQSRKKHQGAALTERLRFTRDGVSESIDLPIERFPILLPFPKFAPPRFLTGGQNSRLDVTGVATISFGPRPEIVGKELGAQELILQSRPDRPVSFARMIAKIGYAMAHALGEIHRLEGPSPVLPSILGDVDDIGRWVGTLTGPIRKYPTLLHRIEIHPHRERRLLVAEVQLFSNSETPTYEAILGYLKSTGS